MQTWTWRDTRNASLIALACFVLPFLPIPYWPTFKEGGVDLVVQNWRGIWAGPGLSAEQVAAITADVEKTVNSATWQKVLADKGWMNTWLAGDEFKAQLATEIENTTAILKDIGLVS